MPAERPAAIAWVSSVQSNASCPGRPPGRAMDHPSRRPRQVGLARLDRCGEHAKGRSNSRCRALARGVQLLQNISAQSKKARILLDRKIARQGFGSLQAVERLTKKPMGRAERALSRQTADQRIR